MQVGIMSGLFRRPTLGAALDAVLAHDIRQVQFNMSSTGLSGPLAEKIRLATPQVRAEMDKRGIAIAALAGQANMVHPHPATRQQGIDRVELLISACQGMGTSVLATCTGSRDPDNMWRNHPDNSSDETWRILCASLEQLLPHAEAHGVTLAFEPEVCQVASSAAKSRRLIDTLASPNLKVVMDAANIFGPGDLARMREVLDTAFELLAEHIAIAHAKDLDADGDSGHLAAGTGKLDYQHYVSLLCGLNFDVPVILHGLSEAQVGGCVAMLRGFAKLHEARA